MDFQCQKFGGESLGGVKIENLLIFATGVKGYWNVTESLVKRPQGTLIPCTPQMPPSRYHKIAN